MWEIYKIIDHIEKRSRVDENFRPPLAVSIFLKQRTMIFVIQFGFGLWIYYTTSNYNFLIFFLFVKLGQMLFLTICSSIPTSWVLKVTLVIILLDFMCEKFKREKKTFLSAIEILHFILQCHVLCSIKSITTIQT